MDRPLFGVMYSMHSTMTSYFYERIQSDGRRVIEEALDIVIGLSKTLRASLILWSLTQILPNIQYSSCRNCWRSNIGKVRPDFKRSIVIWNGDPFSLTIYYPIMVVVEERLHL
ncbi:MAG TPA: hypothetical protein VE692_01505 [Nitrososphaera sp.]|nr:hypothetical protein [Nitrososphaera sp.]